MANLNRIYSPRSAYRVVDMPDWYGGGYDLVSGKKTNNKAYTRSAWANACLNIRGSELSQIPWHITRNGTPIESHPLIEMLMRFGLESNYAEAVEATEIDLLMIGAGYWLRDLDRLQRLNAGTIKVEHDRFGITEFTQTIDGKIVNRFAREEIVYFRGFNPDDDLAPGVAILDVLKPAIDLDVELTQYLTAFVKNDATPGLLLSTDQTVPQPEGEKVLSWWKARFGGPRNKGKPALADRGLKAQILSHSMKENAMVEIRDGARSDICVGFRVPKILVGDMIESTYANAQEARKFLIEDLILSRASYFEGVINADLVRFVDPSVKFEFAIDEITLLQEDTTSKWERLSGAIEKGVISPKFARAEMGWPEDAKPDEAPPEEQPALQSPAARSWEKKALKSLRAGKGANVPFETDEISQDAQIAIKTQLSRAQTPEAVRSAFISPPAPEKADPVINVNVEISPTPAPNVEIHMPEQEPIAVRVELPAITAPPVQVTVNTPKLKSSRETQAVDRSGNVIKGTKTDVTYQYEGE